MASSDQEETWTVFIITEDFSLRSNFTLSPEVPLHEVKQLWRNQHQLSGKWRFMSLDRQHEYSDISTIRSLGQKAPISGVLTLWSEPYKRSVKEISVIQDQTFYQILARDGDRLKHTLPGKSGCGFQDSKKPLCLRQSVTDRNLTNLKTIYQRGTSIRVKLSTGVVRSVELPMDSVVSDLKGVVRDMESSDFHLCHRGRKLELHEDVRNLSKLVEVCRTTFKVTVDGEQPIICQMPTGEIRFPEFAAQLAKASELNVRKLEALTFSCLGCNRQVNMDRQAHQLVETNCCLHRSLNLSAERSSNTEVCDASTSTRQPENINVEIDEMNIQKQNEDVNNTTKPNAQTTEKKEIIINTDSSKQHDPVSNEVVVRSPSISDKIRMPLRVWNYTGSGTFARQVRNVQLMIRAACTVGDVRVVLSRLLERAPENTEMIQYVGETYDGEKAFEVWEEKKKYFYVIADGLEIGQKRLRNLRIEVLDDDNEKFRIPIGRRMYIAIYNR